MVKKRHSVKVTADRGNLCRLNHPVKGSVDVRIRKHHLDLDPSGRLPYCKDLEAHVYCEGEPMITTAYEHCKKWCNDNKPRCWRCYSRKNCGGLHAIGSKRLKTFYDAYEDEMYACTPEQTRSEATASNLQACKNWCNANKPQCVKCSSLKNCGIGYKNMKSWTGHGKNYHACRKR